MGRDTGIVLVTRRRLRDEHDEYGHTMYIGDELVPSWAKIEGETWRSDYEKPDTYIEVVYWRKFHSIAREIDDFLGYDLEKCERRELKLSELERIQNILVAQLKDPDDFEHGFLGPDEIAPMLAQQIMNISWLLDYLRGADDPHAYAYFYDSI